MSLNNSSGLVCFKCEIPLARSFALCEDGSLIQVCKNCYLLGYTQTLLIRARLSPDQRDLVSEQLGGIASFITDVETNNVLTGGLRDRSSSSTVTTQAPSADHAS